MIAKKKPAVNENLVESERLSGPQITTQPDDFQIAPVRGLFIVGAVLIGLLFAIESNSFWALDFYHVVGGAFWTILDLFLGFVLGQSWVACQFSRVLNFKRG